MSGKSILFAFCFAAYALVPAARAVDFDQGFISLCYHDVAVRTSDYQHPDTVPITLARLVDHFDWLHEGGYNVIGVDDILAANSGERPLPEKAVFLSFDDGYASLYTLVFPLLKAYNYKALFALQTTWMSVPEDEPVPYTDTDTLPRSYFITWEQAREMADSGLVEFASHSHDLHRGHIANVHGSVIPAAASLEYDPKTQSYEAPEAFQKRIRDDFLKSAQIIEEKTGRRPRVAVWPYGRYYNQQSVNAVMDAGYVLTASLGLYADGDTFPRVLVHSDLTMQALLEGPARGHAPGNSRDEYRRLDTVLTELENPVYPLERVVHVDLDMLHDPDPVQQEKNVSALFDRLQALDVTTVYLQAYADPDGNGTTDALYFPNRHLPVRSDLFSFVAWGLQRRLGLAVYAWLPVLGFEIPGRPLVQATAPGKEGSTYARLTPFDAENRRIIREIYEDLAMRVPISGVVFHDDAVMGDNEDASPPALEWMAAQGFPPDIDAVRSDRDSFLLWTRMKSEHLTDFTLELAEAMRSWSPPLATCRNMYALAILNPDSEEWLGQNFENFLESYDYTGLMSMPYMEGADADPEGWLVRLADKVKSHPLGRQKVVFELQAVDWRNGAKVPSETLAAQMRLLQENGIGNLGYYPEDPPANHPNVDALYPVFSLGSNAYERRRYDQEKYAQ